MDNFALVGGMSLGVVLLLFTLGCLIEGGGGVLIAGDGGIFLKI